jgi:hypothetical protein
MLWIGTFILFLLIGLAAGFGLMIFSIRMIWRGE